MVEIPHSGSAARSKKPDERDRKTGAKCKKLKNREITVFCDWGGAGRAEFPIKGNTGRTCEMGVQDCAIMKEGVRQDKDRCGAKAKSHPRGFRRALGEHFLNQIKRIYSDQKEDI